MIKRNELISQLRHALNLAESPNEDVVEFEIGDIALSFDFVEHDLCENMHKHCDTN